MDQDSSLLNIVNSHLLNQVAPLANDIDSNSDALVHALQELGELGVLALRVGNRWGGKDVSEQTFHSFQELVARYSGALAFLQTQHQSAAGMLVASRNSALQQEYLPRMGNGEVLLGVGFSQLRRQDTVIVAAPVTGGYKLDGFVPWVTGWGIFSEFIVAATLPDGSAVFGIVPLVETHYLGGRITFSDRLQLVAMTSTNTVTATLTNWFLPQERVVSIKSAGWIHEQDKNNVLRATFLTTGCAQAGIDILESAFRTKSQHFISNALESLAAELNNCRTAIREAQQKGVEFAQCLQLRAWAIDLAVRIAHAAVTVSSGAANLWDHGAGRVYREALVFTVSGQTTAVMEATLERLVRFNEPPSINVTYARVIHLSHVIDSDIPQWDGDPPVDFDLVAELDKDGYYLRRFSMGEHSSTHFNAPKSFHVDGVGVERYSAESLVVPAVVIDVRKQTAVNSDYVLTIADVLAWEDLYGEIPAGCMVLMYTGWQERWLDRNAFLNKDAQGGLHFPGFSGDVTRFLLEERDIAGVGIDTHGVDSGQDTTFVTNRLVLEQPRIVLENLTNLDQLPPVGTTLVIGVLRLRGGSGSPAAVMALVL
ncbi:cyclase family protein [Iningainema tapete]|nr:cyclase family protein [Iningainema tapete]